MVAASLMLEKLEMDEEVDVFQAVQRVRIPRPEMVTSLVSHNVINMECPLWQKFVIMGVCCHTVQAIVFI